jgi:hypothetical protein
MFGWIDNFFDWYADFMLPPSQVPPLPKVATMPEPKGDGRYFAWVRVYDYYGYNPMYPCVIHDRDVGPKLIIHGEVHMMKPHEYGLTISELAAIYPAPERNDL